MFDDLDTAETKIEREHEPSEQNEPSIRGLSRWSPAIAFVVFCFLYFPFKNYSWSWYVAFGSAYSVATFAIALGLALENFDDLTGDPRVSRYVTTLLLPHAFILAAVMLGAYLWFYLKPMLPHWATQSHGGFGKWRLPLWDIFSAFLLWFAGTREGIWMAGKIKRRLKETED
jgi:hypothetical protein